MTLIFFDFNHLEGVTDFEKIFAVFCRFITYKLARPLKNANTIAW